MPAKTRIQLIDQPYLRQGEIKDLLGIGYIAAKNIYGMAREIDEREVGADCLIGRVVRTETVFRVTRLNYAKVRNQIKSAAGDQRHCLLG